MKRAIFLLAAALPLAAPALSQSSDAPPTTPTGLVSDAYSRTAGAISWNRSTDDRGVVGYEITRDGIVLGVRDTLSVVEKDLDPGSLLLYGVTAIDTAGQRSGTASVVLATPGGGPERSPAPERLRAEVYSGTAAELFWTRSGAIGLRHEVRRDGVTIAAIEGTSYFDDTLSRGPTYDYEIIAIDSFGRRSRAASLSLDTTTKGPVGLPGEGDPSDRPFGEPDPDAATALARLGYPAARERTDELVSGAYLSRFHDVYPALDRFLSEETSSGGAIAADCPGGGTVSGEFSLFVFDLKLDGCRIDGRTLSGGLALESDRNITGDGLLAGRDADVRRAERRGGRRGTSAADGHLQAP